MVVLKIPQVEAVHRNFCSIDPRSLQYGQVNVLWSHNMIWEFTNYFFLLRIYLLCDISPSWKILFLSSREISRGVKEINCSGILLIFFFRKCKIFGLEPRRSKFFLHLFPSTNEVFLHHKLEFLYKMNFLVQISVTCGSSPKQGAKYWKSLVAQVKAAKKKTKKP